MITTRDAAPLAMECGTCHQPIRPDALTGTTCSCATSSGSVATEVVATAVPTLLATWEARSREALPADAMLINRHIRELREAIAASANGEGQQRTPDLFVAWLEREMPAGTIIGNPTWWAPKLARALRNAERGVLGGCNG